MAAPTLVNTYSYCLNQTYTPSTTDDMCKYMMWWWKAFLLGQLSYTDQTNTPIVGPPTGVWTIIQCSDSVAVDGTDRWGAVYDPAKIVKANSPTAHSWIILRSPLLKGSQWYFYMDARSTSAEIGICYSKAAPAAGTVNTCPVGADAWSNPSSGGTCWDLRAYCATVSGAVVGPRRIHGCLSSAGAYYVAQNEIAYLSSYSSPDYMAMFWPVETPVGVTDNYPVLIGQNAIAAFTFSVTYPQNSIGIGGMRSIDGLGVDGVGIISPITNTVSATGFRGFSESNRANSDYMPDPWQSLKYHVYTPMLMSVSKYISGSSTAPFGGSTGSDGAFTMYRGWLSDVYLISGFTSPLGARIVNSTSGTDFCAMGNLLLPANAVMGF